MWRGMLVITIPMNGNLAMIVCGTDVIFLGLNLRHHIFVMNSMLYIDLHYMHI